MTEEVKKELTVSLEETTVAAHEDPVKKTGLMRGARDFIENTFANLKGKDINQAVEEFTSEMTIVAEGLSEDQTALRRDLENTSAQLTLLDEKLKRVDDSRKDEFKEAKELLSKLDKRMDKLEKQVEALEKATQKAPKLGLADILKQSTWLVGIFCASWVIVTLLRLIGG